MRIDELPAWASTFQLNVDAAHAEIERLRAQIEQMAAHPLAVTAEELEHAHAERTAKLRAHAD